MASKKYHSHEEYNASFPPATQVLLGKMRALIKEAAPTAIEVISYNMPAIKMNQILVYYAAYKEHIGFYPTSSPIRFFKAELTGYKTSKGAIQFPLNKKLPSRLIKKIVQFRVKEDLGTQG